MWLPRVKASTFRPVFARKPAAAAGRAAGKRAKWWLAPLAAGVLLIVALAQTPPGHAVMRWTGLEARPAPYSELYFTDSKALPVQLPAGHFSLPVSFAVHNATPDALTYRWTVQRVTGTRAVRTSSGQFALGPGATAVTRRVVTGNCQPGALQVVVRLASPAESIDFRTVCRA